MENLQVFLDGHTKKIRKTLDKVVDNFLYVGFLLWEVREFRYYEVSYDNFLDYVGDMFGFSKSSAYNFISLCERFSERDGNGNPTFKIEKKYKGYTMSQLTEMLKFSDSQITENVLRSMSVRQIRELKKDFKKVVKEDKEVEKVQTSGLFQDKGNVKVEFDKDYYFDYVFCMLEQLEKVVEDNGASPAILGSIEMIRVSIKNKFGR